MAKFGSFEEIVAWQKSRTLVKQIYEVSENWRDLSMKDQVRRASVSVMSNIAEGFEKQTNKDFRHFLYISKGSCGEVRSLITIAQDIGLIDKTTAKKLLTDAQEVSRIISGLIKTL